VRLAVAQELRYIGEQQQARYVNQSCAGQLIGKPKAEVEIWYPPDDLEAFVLAEQIYDCLGPGTKDKSGAGWVVSKPGPIPDKLVLDPNLANAPLVLKNGGGWGVGIVSRDLVPVGFNTAVPALEFALSVGVTPKSGFTGMSIPSLPEDAFIVVVGPKPPAIPWQTMQALKTAITNDAKKTKQVRKP
jgi:hypothetical protein